MCPGSFTQVNFFFFTFECLFWVVYGIVWKQEVVYISMLKKLLHFKILLDTFELHCKNITYIHEWGTGVYTIDQCLFSVDLQEGKMVYKVPLFCLPRTAGQRKGKWLLLSTYQITDLQIECIMYARKVYS